MTKKNNQSLVNKTGREIRVYSDIKLKEQRKPAEYLSDMLDDMLINLEK